MRGRQRWCQPKRVHRAPAERPALSLTAGSFGDGFAPCDWDIYIYIYHAIISTMGYNVLVASCSNEPTVFLTDAEFGAAIPPACRMCFFRDDPRAL